MDDFDTRLRADLLHAAETAPEFTGLHPSQAQRSRPSPWTAALVAAAGVAGIAGGGAWWASTDDPQMEGSCPALLEFNGRTYHGHGEMLRTPRPGARIGTGSLPGCGDPAQAVSVRALPGVNDEVAVLSDSGLWVSDAVGPLPPEVDMLDRPVTCADSGTVAGNWVALEGPMPTRDDELSPPYTAVVEVDQGDHLPLEKWRMVTIRLRVTPDTIGGTDGQLAEHALRGPERVRATVHCDGDRFVAESITRAD